VTSDTARYTARIVRGSRSAAVGTSLFAIATLVLALLPWWGSNATQFTLIEVLYYLSLAQLWNLLAGYAGLVSVGQQGFVGVGAYATFIFAERNGIDPWVSLVLAGLFVAALSVPVALFAFRLEGGYFAIGTWVIAEVFRLSFANMSIVGGGSGTSLTALRGIERATRESLTFWIALVCVVAAIGGVYLFLRSQLGLALLAIRDNEVAAESQGIDVKRTKLAVYLAAAFGAGLAGALYFVGNLRISPDAAFSVNWTAFAIFMVVIGGLGRIEGPIVGAVLFWALNRFFSDYGSWYLMGLGLLAIGVTIFFRQGLWGWLQQRHGWSLFPTTRRLNDQGAAR
jgi:branched-chain amino acid transport system permease protein